ncbi:hypothetical protein [Caulobacter vibrioides]|uniref:hypothetical protein n=1 Tax=Caulobacter vibrioides TaxID=155892 RepID=UPI000BB4ED00|nr:hypothetical protein [Caulobacter vibrioides]ATC25194.1 hypothetical protein CA608_11980 [Caulobacter vibrioides]PLR13964.1 hypothetical protein CVUC_05280 [Caulobacter vibrioides]
MKGLTAKDREVLGLYAARMSTASIAAMCGGTEAAIYNRLTRLQVTSVSQALEQLRVDDEARKAPRAPADPKPRPPCRLDGLAEIGSPAFGKLLADLTRGAELAAAWSAIDPAFPSAATAPPSPAPAASPTAARPPAYSRGGLRLNPVSDRVARWAGHFLRARWPLHEVADLFDVAEDDLAQARVGLA